MESYDENSTALKKIVLTGPECTGKTTLAKALAKHYKAQWVPEFARDYLELLDRPYRESDLIAIAKVQVKRESQFEEHSNTFLFYDTDLTVIKIWQQYKYGQANRELLDLMASKEYHLYQLTVPDFPWEHDKLRENPNDREELFKVYREELNNRKLPYRTISGSLDSRLSKAIKYIDQLN